jgi:hypothetical protein
MAGSRLDRLTRLLATPSARRGMPRALAASTLGGLARSDRVGRAAGPEGDPCIDEGGACTNHVECCDGRGRKLGGGR